MTEQTSISLERGSYQASKAFREAHFNEYKGVLFEFLFAQACAQAIGCERQFLDTLPIDLRQRLEAYEQVLRRLAPILHQQLRPLALEATRVLDEKLRLSSWQGVALKPERSFNEEDCLLWKENIRLPLSLKLIVERGQVNTKSGGVKSFLEKYLFFDRDDNPQEEFNLQTQVYHQKMLEELRSSSLNDPKQTLPGQLPLLQRRIVHRCYHQMAQLLYTYFKQWWDASPHDRLTKLAQLAGLSDERLIQVITFVEKDSYQLKEIKIQEIGDFQSALETATLSGPPEHKSYFQIVMKDRILHIRVKPMNEFTAPALKINCAISFKEQG